MKKIIHNLRQKPERTRKHILNVSMVFVAVIMISFWVLSLGKTFSDPDLKTKTKQDLQSFTVLKDNLMEGYSTE